MVPIRALMDELNMVFAKGDAHAIAEFYTDDAVLTVAGARYEGKDRIREYWRQLCRAFPDRTSENGRGVEVGDTFFGEITVRATHTGELELPDGTTFPATGTANPTLTVAALALRASETIVKELQHA